MKTCMICGRDMLIFGKHGLCIKCDKKRRSKKLPQLNNYVPIAGTTKQIQSIKQNKQQSTNGMPQGDKNKKLSS